MNDQDPWELLLKIPERGWSVFHTDRRMSMIQLQAGGLLLSQYVTPGVYQVRLTAAGRLLRERLGRAQ